MELRKKGEYLAPEVEVVRVNLEAAFMDSFNNSVATSSEKSEVEWDF